MSAIERDSGIKQGEVVPRRSDAEWADVIRADLAASVQGIIGAGRHLVQAKEQVGHGNWSAWLLRELRMDYRTAQRFMAIGRNPVLANATHASHLPASWMTLYALSRAPETRLVKAIESGIVTPEMERKDAERWVEAERVRGLGLTGGPGRGGTAGSGRKTAEPPVSPGHAPNDSKTAEDKPEPVQQPAGQVQESVKTGTAEPVTTTTEPVTTTETIAGTGQQETCQHDYRYVCRTCGKPDRVFSGDFDKLMRELTAKDEKIARQAKTIEDLQAKLSAAPGGAELAAPHSEPQTAPEAADSAHGGAQPGSGQFDADGTPMPDYDDDLSWMADPEPDYEASQAPGRRR